MSEVVKREGLVFNPAVIKTIPEIETVLSKATQDNNEELFNAAYERLFALTKQKYKDVADPIERKVYQGLDMWVSLGRARGKRGVGNRTKQKLKRVGPRQFLIDTVRNRTISKHSGFTFNVTEQHPELTTEYIVVENAPEFPREIVELAKARLLQYKLDVPRQARMPRRKSA